MLDGLHIEMAIWKTLGLLIQAGIETSSTADSFLKVFHFTRTRHAHQLSALALNKLQHKAFLGSEGPYDDSIQKRPGGNQQLSRAPHSFLGYDPENENSRSDFCVREISIHEIFEN